MSGHFSKSQNRVPNSIPRRQKLVIVVLLLLVVVSATLQLAKDIQGNSFGLVFASLAGINQENQLAASRPPDPPGKSSFLTDNYNLCQNKLGADVFEINGGKIGFKGTTVGLSKLDLFMKDIYLTGARYFVIRTFTYSGKDVGNLIELIHHAKPNHLVPIVIWEFSPAGYANKDFEKNVSGIFSVLNQISKAFPDSPFITTTVSKDLYDTAKGPDDHKNANQIAQDVAKKMFVYPNIATATTPLIVDDNADPDRLHAEYELGLGPHDDDTSGLQYFDYLMLTGLTNSDVGFDVGQSLYQNRGYFKFFELDPNQVYGKQQFRAKQWLRDENNQRFRQHMQAIVVDFGPTPGTEGEDRTKLLQRLGADFTSFSADPDIAAVVFQSKLGLNDKELTQLNTFGTLCNYDTKEIDYSYDAKSTALACDIKTASTPTIGQGDPNTKITCGGDRCTATIKYTVQVGLPIRSFGSNSAAGTDTNPYLPISAYVATTSNLSEYNSLLQYSQVIKGSDGSKYVMPWLGNALFNSSELLRTRFTFDKTGQLLKPITPNSGAYSLNYLLKLDEGYAYDQTLPYDYRAKTLWCFTANSLSAKQLIPSEMAVYKGKQLCYRKDQLLQSVDSLQSYDPEKFATVFNPNVNACGGTVPRVKTDPQNMIYGLEQDLSTDRWDSSAAELCYAIWTGNSKVSGSINCITRPFSYIRPDNGQRCVCPNNKGLLISQYSITAGLCGGMSTADMNACIIYKGGADSGSSGITFRSTLPSTPKYNIPGAYSSLAALYKNVQDQLSVRGLKFIFRENWGWQSDVILRAYKGENSCKVGLNFATFADQTGGGSITEAGKLGYKYGVVIMTGGEGAENVAGKLSEMCAAGITPVLRSCTKENCNFKNGADQAAYINDVSSAMKCGKAYIVCGHNESISEYQPTGDTRSNMQAEGKWVKDCISGIDTKGGQVQPVASIFNGTYDDGTTDAPKSAQYFMDGFSGGDWGKVACVGVNVYAAKDNNDPSKDVNVSYFYERFKKAFDDKGVKTNFCVTETGYVSGYPDGKPAGTPYPEKIIPIFQYFGTRDEVLFAAGYNFTNTNPGWSTFALNDKGASLVQSLCGSGGNTVSPTGAQLGATGLYPADGTSWQLQHQYYQMLGFIDELVRLNDILVHDNVLPSGNLVTDINTGTTYKESIAELFAGWYGCGSPAEQALAAKGIKVNCIGLISDKDPLGGFLCSKGYAVDSNCSSTLQCTYDANGEIASITKVKSLADFQPGLVQLTEKIESKMCIPNGLLMAMLEREITSQIGTLSGDPYQTVYPKKEGKHAWGPAQFTDIAWKIGNSPAYGKSSGYGFLGLKSYEYSTKACLDALGIDYTKVSLYEEGSTPENFVLDRSVVGYALCAAAAKLKNDSATHGKCSGWTKEDVLQAAKSYLGNCSQNGRPYCDAYPQTMCVLYPLQNSTLCGDSTISCDSDNIITNPSDPESGKSCSGAPLNGTPYTGTVIMPIVGASDTALSPNGHFGDHRDYACPTDAYHTGVDLVYPLGTKVVAVADGYVIAAGLGQDINDASAPYGKFIKIQHGSDFYSFYGHLSEILVQPGEKVTQGQVIGKVGSTTYDYSTGFNHLHFELRRFCTCKCDSKAGSCWIDPLPVLEAGNTKSLPPVDGGSGGLPGSPDPAPADCKDNIGDSPAIINVPGYTINTNYIQAATANRRKLTCEANAGRELLTPKGVVLHWTAGVPVVQRAGTLASMRSEEITYNGKIYLHPSAQFFISVEGEIYQIGYFPNYFQNHATGFSWDTIGIENEGRAKEDLTAAQVAANAALIKALQARFPTIKYLVAHDQADNIAYSNQCDADFKSLVLPSRLVSGIGCKSDTGTEFLSKVGDKTGLKYCANTTYNCISP